VVASTIVLFARGAYLLAVHEVHVVAVTVVAGAAVAAMTLPGANHLQDRVTAQVGLDER
jgi:hypothetical protein